VTNAIPAQSQVLLCHPKAVSLSELSPASPAG
jgi:hypothetical protein